MASNKNDARDPHGIWVAVQQPGVKEAAVKSEEQHAVLAIHSIATAIGRRSVAELVGLDVFHCGREHEVFSNPAPVHVVGVDHSLLVRRPIHDSDHH